MDATLKMQQYIQEMLFGLKEILVGKRELYFISKSIQQIKQISDNYKSELVILQLPKLFFESSIFISSGLIILIAIFMNKNFEALQYFPIFILSSFRILPSLIRINGNLLILRAAVPQSKSFHQLMHLINDYLHPNIERQSKEGTLHSLEFIPKIEFFNVDFQYVASNVKILNNFSCSIQTGESVLVTGYSGNGKSTFLDLLTGMLEPCSGKILISSLPPKLATSTWPGTIAYIPQKIVLLNSSLRENILFGLDSATVPDDDIWNVLNIVEITEVLRKRSLTLDSMIGEAGNLFSGGQQQRIGIARGLIGKPRILVLDEATSALDEALDTRIMAHILELRGITKIVVSHRRSMIDKVDRVIRLNKD